MLRRAVSSVESPWFRRYHRQQPFIQYILGTRARVLYRGLLGVRPAPFRSPVGKNPRQKAVRVIALIPHPLSPIPWFSGYANRLGMDHG